MKYGVQLYSLRNIGQSQGLEAILKLVSECGFDGVEFAGFYGHTPSEVKDLCDKYNLIPYSAHIRAVNVEENLDYIKTLGFKVVYTPGIWAENWKPENYPTQLENQKKAYELLKSIGVEYGYHNHSHEYVDGNDYVDKITTDVRGMKIESDLCWITNARLNLVEKLKEYEGRLKCIHVKELVSLENKDLPAPIIGEGVVDMEGAFKEAKRQGIEWGILEVEGFSVPEKEYLLRSLENMKKFAK